jgi:hypothetical protein
MSDLTVIYYTANRISQRFADVVRAELFAAVCFPWPFGQLMPIVMVSHESIQHGPYSWPDDVVATNIVVGDVRPSIWQVYQNILIGAKAASTPYVACCEDDTLYVPEHFTYRPPLDTFAYNENRVVITRKLSDDGKRRVAFYYYRPRTQMAMCIAPRALLIETLEEKFAKYPTPPASTDVAKKAGWGEPGRYEKNLGLTPRKLERFHWTERPNVTFNHSESLMGRRAVQETDVLYDTVEPWGDATALWSRIHGLMSRYISSLQSVPCSSSVSCSRWSRFSMRTGVL